MLCSLLHENRVISLDHARKIIEDRRIDCLQCLIFLTRTNPDQSGQAGRAPRPPTDEGDIAFVAYLFWEEFSL
jgi:hypothetical protein